MYCIKLYCIVMYYAVGEIAIRAFPHVSIVCEE